VDVKVIVEHKFFEAMALTGTSRAIRRNLLGRPRQKTNQPWDFFFTSVMVPPGGSATFIDDLWVGGNIFDPACDDFTKVEPNSAFHDDVHYSLMFNSVGLTTRACEWVAPLIPNANTGVNECTGAVIARSPCRNGQSFGLASFFWQRAATTEAWHRLAQPRQVGPKGAKVHQRNRPKDPPYWRFCRRYVSCYLERLACTGASASFKSVWPGVFSFRLATTPWRAPRKASVTLPRQFQLEAHAAMATRIPAASTRRALHASPRSSPRPTQARVLPTT
jgi:hypothetical protein